MEMVIIIIIFIVNGFQAIINYMNLLKSYGIFVVNGVEVNVEPEK